MSMPQPQISVDEIVENGNEFRSSRKRMSENQFNILTVEQTSRIVVSALVNHVESGCLRRWRIPRESGARRYRGRGRRLGRRNCHNQEVDRPPGQQRGRVRSASRSVAVRFGSRRESAPCFFRFRSRSQTDDRRILLPQFAPVFIALDMPKISTLARVLDIAHSSRAQRSSQPTSQLRSPKAVSIADGIRYKTVET